MKITELCALKSRRLRVTGPGWWRILQCIFHLNHLVNSNLIWTCNEFCCTIHNIFHIYSWYEIFGWIFSIHSDFLLTPLKTDDFSKKNVYYIHMMANSVLVVKSSIVPASNKMTFCSFMRISLIFDTRLATPPKHLLVVHGDANWKEERKKYRFITNLPLPPRNRGDSMVHVVVCRNCSVIKYVKEFKR